MDDKTANLIRQRLAELEVETTQSQTTKFTMASLTNKDLNRDRELNRRLVQIAMLEGTGSKALPAQYEHKADTSHDITAAAVRHHTGSHYHMAGSVQFQRGLRLKGVVSRHSKQAAVRNGKKQKSASTLGMLGKA